VNKQPGHHSARGISIGPPGEAAVWIDFDRTITRRDVLDDLIEKYAVDKSWLEVERLWQTGQIGSRECLRQEFALIRIDDAALHRFLDHVAIDPGFVRLVELLAAHRVPLSIVSDGIDWFIDRILHRAGVSHIPVRANTLSREGQTMALLCPHHDPACVTGAAHCKCSSIRILGDGQRRSIYIGDGRSDLCPARTCDVVFAKLTLAELMATEGRPFIPFVTLNDVADTLTAAWGSAAASNAIPAAAPSVASPHRAPAAARG
jgi:2,3-diketo-5-methylthio-1-phosphopentane phosphatase